MFFVMAFKNWYFVLALAFLVAAGNGAREITDPAKFMLSSGYSLAELPAGYNLEERLAANGGLVECWSALSRIKSCSKEIELFFLHWQAKIGPECCRAISVITHNCWPTVLSYLGFTPEEANILRGHCDGSAPTPTSPCQATAPAQPQ